MVSGSVVLCCSFCRKTSNSLKFANFISSRTNYYLINDYLPVLLLLQLSSLSLPLSE